MRHKNIDEGDQPKSKAKPRGRPFSKGYAPHNKGKSNPTLLDDSGCEIGDSRPVIAPEPQSSIVEPKKEELSPLAGAGDKMIQAIDQITKENMEKPATNEEDELVEEMSFMNGSNKLSIRFSKKHNRMYRVQVFLNDETQIRPVTYTGASTGYAYWNLLKGALKK